MSVNQWYTQTTTDLNGSSVHYQTPWEHFPVQSDEKISLSAQSLRALLDGVQNNNEHTEYRVRIVQKIVTLIQQTKKGEDSFLTWRIARAKPIVQWLEETKNAYNNSILQFFLDVNKTFLQFFEEVERISTILHSSDLAQHLEKYIQESPEIDQNPRENTPIIMKHMLDMFTSLEQKLLAIDGLQGQAQQLPKKLLHEMKHSISAGNMALIVSDNIYLTYFFHHLIHALENKLFQDISCQSVLEKLSQSWVLDHILVKNRIIDHGFSVSYDSEYGDIFALTKDFFRDPSVSFMHEEKPSRLEDFDANNAFTRSMNKPLDHEQYTNSLKHAVLEEMDITENISNQLKTIHTLFSVVFHVQKIPELLKFSLETDAAHFNRLQKVRPEIGHHAKGENFDTLLSSLNLSSSEWENLLATIAGISLNHTVKHNILMRSSTPLIFSQNITKTLQISLFSEIKKHWEKSEEDNDSLSDHAREVIKYLAALPIGKEVIGECLSNSSDLQEFSVNVLENVYEKLFAEADTYFDALRDKPTSKRNTMKGEQRNHFHIRFSEHGEIAWCTEVPVKKPAPIIGIDEIAQKVLALIDTNKAKQQLLSRYPWMQNSLQGNMIILWPYGTGKTWLIRELAYHEDIATISVSGSDFLSMRYGVAEKNVKALFQQAELLHKKIGKKVFILFDEFDSFFGQNDHASSWYSDKTTKNMKNELQIMLDGENPFEGVHFIWFSNSIEKIPMSIYRRSQRVIFPELRMDQKKELIESRLWFFPRDDGLKNAISALSFEESTDSEEINELKAFITEATPKIISTLCEKTYTYFVEWLSDTEAGLFDRVLHRKDEGDSRSMEILEIRSISLHHMLNALEEMKKDPVNQKEIDANARFYENVDRLVEKISHGF